MRTKKLKKMLSMLLVVILAVSSINFSGLNTATVKALSAKASISYMDGGLSNSNTTVGKLTDSSSTAMMCNIYVTSGGSTEKVFCMGLNDHLSTGDIMDQEPIGSKYGKWQDYIKGAFYYYKDPNNEFSLSTYNRYIVCQATLWRILQLRGRGTSASYDNLMTSDYKSILSDICSMAGISTDTAWDDLKKVMKFVSDEETKVLDKTDLYILTNSDKQPLLRGKADPSPEQSRIAINKSGVIGNADLKGAVYGVYKDRACKKRIAKITTDKDGYGITSADNYDIKPNKTYYVKELKAPEGSELDPTIYPVETGESGSVRNLNVTDEQFNITIDVLKVDEDNGNKSLPGAEFTIYEWAKGQKKYVKHSTIISESNGHAVSGTLYYTKTNLGLYRIKETKAPAGYKNSGWSKDISIKKTNTGKPVTYTVDNKQKLGYIQLQKSAVLNGTVYADENLTATYGVYSDSTCKTLVTTIKTNSTGLGKSKKLPVGTYYVKETSWSTGVTAKTSQTQEVTVNTDATTKLTYQTSDVVIQVPWWFNIEVKKKADSLTGYPIENAEFSVYEWTGASYGKKVTSFKTDVNGYGKTDDYTLVYTRTNKGKFKIVETSAGEGYINSYYSEEFVLSKDNSTTTVAANYVEGLDDENNGVIFNNPANGNLKIHKEAVTYSGGTTNISLFGISYALYGNQDAEGNLIDKVADLVLDEDGNAEIKDLQPGIYYLQETYTNPIFAYTALYFEKTRTVEVLINRNKTTVVDGKLGVSYDDGNTYTTSWSTAGDGFVNLDTSTVGTDNPVTALKIANQYTSVWNPKRTLEYFGTVTDYYTASEGYMTTIGSGLNTKNIKTLVLSQNTKGNAGFYLKNAITYDGKTVDIKATFTDWDIVADRTGFMPSTISSTGTLFGLNIDSGIKSLKVKYEFFEAGTDTPVNIKGVAKLTDIDAEYVTVDTSGITGYSAPTTDAYTVSNNTSANELKITGKGVEFSSSDDYAYIMFSGNSLNITYGEIPEKCIKRRLYDNMVSPAAVGSLLLTNGANALMNIVKGIEIGIVKVDSTDDSKLLTAVFNIYQWSESTQRYEYVRNVSASTTAAIGGRNGAGRVVLDYTGDNLGKFKIEEASVSGAYIPSGYSKEINMFDLPTCDYVEGKYKPGEISDQSVLWYDKGVYLSDRYYQSLSIVRESNDSDVFYQCQVPNIGKPLTDETYWKQVTYADLNSAAEWDSQSDLISYVGIEVGNKPELPDKTDIYIVKSNENDSSLVPGAEFKAYTEDGNEYGTFKDNGDGNYSLEDIDLADIEELSLTIKETKAPYGYQNPDFEQTVTITKDSSGNVVHVPVIYVSEKPIELKINGIKKAEGVSYDPSTLAGAVYGLYEDKDCLKQIDTATVDENGEFSFKAVTLKDYFVKEIKGPDSGLFKLSDEVFELKASDLYSGETDIETLETTVTVTEEPITVPVTITKQREDEGGSLVGLAGAGFTLYAVSDLEGVDIEDYLSYQNLSFDGVTPAAPEVFTNDEGYAKTAEVIPGYYILVESTVPDGFKKVDNQLVHLTTSEAGVGHYITLTNEPEVAPIKILKTCSKTEKVVPDAKFKIFSVALNAYLTEDMESFDEEGNLVTTAQDKIFVTGTDGYVFTDPLPSGEYIVEECEAAPGYFLSDEKVTVVIGGSDAKTDEAGNVYYEVSMKNEPTQTKLSKQDITSKAELTGGHYTVEDEEGTIVDEWDGNGQPHYIYGLIPGETYVMTEEIVPDGYVQAESVEFTVNEDGTVTEVVMFDDYTKTSFSKMDITGTSELVGGLYTVEDEEGNVLDEWTGTGMPHIINYLVPDKTYFFTEKIAPDGYLIAEKIEFTIGESSEIQEVVMYDDYTKYEFIKLAQDTEEPLVGVTLQVLDELGKAVDEWVTDGESHMTYKLIPGKTYRLHEKQSVAGYNLAPDIEFTVEETPDIVTITMTDKPTTVTVLKTDEDGTPLEGVPLQLLDDKGNIVAEWVTNCMTGNGMSVVVKPGTYTIHEVKPLDGYAPIEDKVITVTDKDITVTLINESIGTVIKKVDADTGHFLQGIPLQLLDEDGNVVEEWVTDGKAHTCTNLVFGKTYTLHEVKPLPSYTVADDITFTVTEVKQTVTLKNAKTSATFKKVNIFGMGLNGGEFQILDTDGNVIKEFKADVDGVTFRGLEKGKYIYREVKAPNGYELAEDIEFEIGEEPITVTMTDEFTILDLPHTGGTPFNFMMLSLLVLLVAMITFTASLKKKAKNIK